MPEHVINDDNYNDFNHRNWGVCGCLPRREAYGTLACATSGVPDIIPMEDWPRLIKAQEDNADSLWHIWKDSDIGVLNQNPLNFCWGFSCTEVAMIMRELMRLDYRPLSPSSVSAPIVGYLNKGWYIEDALKELVSTGAATTDFVPATTYRSADFKPKWRESAYQNRITKWRDCPHDFQAQGSMLLMNRPLATALNWWGHAVCFLRVLDRHPNLSPTDHNRYGILYLNSWGESFGDGGCGILEGTKKIADSAWAAEQCNFSE